MVEKTMVVQLINYFDVWGNAEDGFEVNNLCNAGSFDLSEDFTNEELLEALIEFGFVIDTATMEDITFEWAGSEMVEIYETANRYPLGRVELPF